MSDRNSAMREEARIKQLDRAAKLALIASSEPVSTPV
jgi:predicted GIY-YIG superfamily endonuclease